MKGVWLMLLFCLISGEGGAESSVFQLLSPAFLDRGNIPIEFSSQGTNSSPPLLWANEPPGTKSYVLMMIDFDAEKSVDYPILHWLVYNLNAQRHSLRKNADDVSLGLNGYGLPGYIGMNPPFSEKHRYTFRLFAVGLETLNLPEHASVQQVLMAMNHHILAEAHLTGYYQRPSPVPELNNIYLEE